MIEPKLNKKRINHLLPGNCKFAEGN